MVKIYGRKFKKHIRRRVRRVAKKAIKRFQRKQPVTAIGRPVAHGFPRMMKFTHRYVEQVQLTGTSGAVGSHYFSCNGLFDPNYTGGGRQPLGFDQMTAIYDHYCVVGSRCIIKAANHNSATAATVVGIYVNDDTSNVLSSVAAYVANSTKMSILPYGGGKTVTLAARWSAKKFFGRGVLANSEIQGTSSTNPSEQSYYVIHCASMDGVATTTVDVIVDLEYIAIWKETKEMDLS